ncbi:MAG TPA: rhomboid family intramembrane serine protease [Gemmatimonadaceae bacterium]|jgi:membrane associated rhomboid family serine protease|nr:rhomboid family intramembrane serine protease [Gemmatimonadaceae bacterium]
MTPWVLRLLFANVAIFALTFVNPRLLDYMAFSPGRVLVMPWTIITYMFAHGGPWHLIFNMLSLYFFGPRVESRLGSGRFITLYFVSGLAAAALGLLESAPIVGASGAVFGVFMAYARFWPHDKIYIWGILPVEARVLLLFTTFYAVFSGLGRFGGGIAHWAHLGGIIGAYLYLQYIGQRSPEREFKRKMDKALFGGPTGVITDDLRPELIRRDGLHPLNIEELDRLGEKVKAHGASSLTSEERAFLHRMRSR